MSRKTRTVNIRENPSYDVYIGRNMNPMHPNILSNRYSIGVDGSREEVVRKFAYDFRIRWKTEPEFRQAVLAARGRVLGCFCNPDQLCHGQVIADFVDAFIDGEDASFRAIEKYINIQEQSSIEDMLNAL